MKENQTPSIVVGLLAVTIVLIGAWFVYSRFHSSTLSGSSTNIPMLIASGTMFSDEFIASPPVLPSGEVAPGGLGDVILKSEIWQVLLNYESRSINCANVSSQAIRLAQINEAGEYWVEDWTVNACGRTKVFKITFSPGNPDGTKYVITDN